MQKLKPMHTTQPHAAQMIYRVDDGDGTKYTPDNEIFVIQDTYEKNKEIALVGSEISDIVKWWTEYNKSRSS